MNTREIKFLKALELLERLRIARGEGVVTIGDVGRWAGLKKATAYRIGKKLIMIKLVTYQEFDYKGKKARDIHLTELGQEYQAKFNGVF